MFEVIPVVNADLGRDIHYFRKWHKKNIDNDIHDCNEKYVADMARLEQLEESCRNSVRSINGKFIFIGNILSIIENERLYKDVYSGVGDKYCQDIYRYAFIRLGLKHTTTFNLISVANTFATNGELLPKWKDFSYSQLCEMLSMSEQDREKVKSDMTVKQIRELKNSLQFLNSQEIQTSEFSVEDNEEVIKNTIKEQRIEKLAKLLEDGDAYHLWDKGKKDFNSFAKFLLDNGVSVKL